MSRLTHSQYNNTVVRDLLGETKPVRRINFHRKTMFVGSKNQSEVQSIPVLLAEA